NGLIYLGVDGAPANQGEFNCAAAVSQNNRVSNLVTAINADTRTGTLGDVSATRNTNIALVSNQTGAGANVVTASLNMAGGGSASLLATNFIGGNDVHPMLMYMRDVRSSILIEATTPISVPAPTGLSYSSQTSNTVDLNFTEPTPNANGTDCFEVW